MTPEQIENNHTWVAALRSGKYYQGADALRSKDDRFCCLGVDADIAKVECSLVARSYSYNFSGVGAGRASLAPARRVCAPDPDWFITRHGFDYENVKVNGDSLITANDGGVPFDAIALAIEDFCLKQFGIRL